MALTTTKARPATKSRVAAQRMSPPGDVNGVQRLQPRLLNLHQAAQYLGLSYWTCRDYVLADLIPAVHLPPLRPREGATQRRSDLRRILLDRCDLDAFIESRKRR